MNRNDAEEILKKSGKKIYNYLLKILRNKEDAEDVYQEVFVAFFKRIKTVSPDSYESYLFQTAYHKALNYIKKRKKLPSFEYNPEIDGVEEYSYYDDKKNRIIRESIQKLKPIDALLIELQFYQGKSYKEIADIVSLSVSAVDSKLVRAKKKLKKIILQDFKNFNVL